jgi:hypothetical protein
MRDHTDRTRKRVTSNEPSQRETPTDMRTHADRLDWVLRRGRTRAPYEPLSSSEQTDAVALAVSADAVVGVDRIRSQSFGTRVAELREYLTNSAGRRRGNRRVA